MWSPWHLHIVDFDPKAGQFSILMTNEVAGPVKFETMKVDSTTGFYKSAGSFFIEWHLAVQSVVFGRLVALEIVRENLDLTLTSILNPDDKKRFVLDRNRRCGDFSRHTTCIITPTFMAVSHAGIVYTLNFLNLERFV